MRGRLILISSQKSHYDGLFDRSMSAGWDDLDLSFIQLDQSAPWTGEGAHRTDTLLVDLANLIPEQARHRISQIRRWSSVAPVVAIRENDARTTTQQQTLDADTTIRWHEITQSANIAMAALWRAVERAREKAEARLATKLVAAAAPGLTLSFDRRLHRFDPTAFDALIRDLLGDEATVTIEERSNLGDDGPGWIRLNGPDPDELVPVAEAFYERVWRKQQGDAADAEDRALARTVSALEALFGPRLDAMRDDLGEVKASTDLFANEEVREAITDKAGDHASAKRKKTNQTRLRRITEGLLLEAPKALVSTYLGASAGEVAGEVVGEIAAKAVGAMTKAVAGEIAHEVQTDVKRLLDGKAADDG
jgi:hypothetical protein